MVAKKSAKKPKGRDRKAAKVGNLAPKTLSSNDVRGVKGGRALGEGVGDKHLE